MPQEGRCKPQSCAKPCPIEGGMLQKAESVEGLRLRMIEMTVRLEA